MPNPGVLGKLWVGDSVGAAKRLNIISESIGAVTSYVDGDGLKGTRSRYSSLTREGEIGVGGTIRWFPQPTDLDYLFPYIMGGTPTGSGTVTYPLGESLSAFNVYKTTAGSGAKQFTYAGMKVARFSLMATRGQPVECSMDLIGQTEAVASSGNPTTTFDSTSRFFMFHDLAVTLIGSSSKPMQFGLTVDNGLLARFVGGSRTADAIYSADRVVTTTITVPADNQTYTAFSDVAVAVVATFTYTGESLSLAMNAVRFTNVTEKMTDRSEVLFTLAGQAFNDGTNLELITALDSSV